MSDHSFIINVRKYSRHYSRRCLEKERNRRTPNILTKMAQRRSIMKPSEEIRQKYALPNIESIHLQTVKDPVLLLPYQRYLKQQRKFLAKRRTELKTSERYKMLSTDIQNRCGQDNISDQVKTITNCDKDFFKIVDGRHIKQKVPIYRTLQTAHENLFRIRHEIAVRKDCMYNIDINIRTEQSKYNIAFERCAKQVQQFNKFIADDYEKSVGYLHRWEKLKQKLDKKLYDLHNVANEKFGIISRLLKYEHQLRVQQEYGRFLYYMSPPTWRLDNREFARSIEIESKGFDLGLVDNVDTFSVIFEELVKECYSTNVKPVLFFKKPEDLMKVFTTIELQQLNHFTYLTYIRPFVKKLTEEIVIYKASIDKETAQLVSMVKSFKQRLEIDEQRNEELKYKFFQILYGTFYDSVGRPEVLKLSVDLEFVYEQVFNDKPMRNDIVHMAKSLEICFLNIMRDLDKIHGCGIKEAVKKCMDDDKRKMKQAKEASKELRLFHRLERSMLNAVSPKKAPLVKIEKIPPIASDKPRPSYRKFDRVSRSKSRPTLINPVLSEAERDYLTMFTDWTEDQDPAKYLLSWNNDF